MTSSRNVLVVDEDLDQLQTLCRGLRCLGFCCIPARTAAEALAHLDGTTGQRVDVVVADVTLPGRPGARLVERALALRPALPVLLLAGLVLPREAQALRDQGLPLLRKPFGLVELGAAVEAL